jgi:hypothetical protein
LGITTQIQSPALFIRQSEQTTGRLSNADASLLL